MRDGRESGQNAGLQKGTLSNSGASAAAHPVPPSLSSFEDPGGPRSVDHPALGGESAGPFHHHRFYSIVVNRKLVSMPCDVPVDDGRGGAVPCGLTWEENVEIAVTRYDRANRRKEGKT